MSKITDLIEKSAKELQSYAEHGQVNGNFSNDGLINLYDAIKELEDTSEEFRKQEVKPEVFDRAKSSGRVDEEGRPVFWGEDKLCSVSGRGYSQTDNETIFEEAKSKDSIDEAVDFLADLMKKSGFSATAVREAMQNGELPQEAYEKVEADHDNPVYVNTDDREVVEA